MNGYSPKFQLLQMITGFWAPQVIVAAVKTDTLTCIAEEASTVARLSEKLSMPQWRLDRFISALAALRLVYFDEHYKLYVSELGRLLLPDEDGSLAHYVRLIGDRYSHAWSCLPELLRRDDESTGYMQAWGEDIFSERDPQIEAHFYRAMRAFSRDSALELAEILKADRVRALLDVGGGDGTMAAMLTERIPTLLVTVFDRASLQSICEGTIGAHHNIAFLAGDLTASLPAGYDAHLLFRVAHNLSDRQLERVFEHSVQTLNVDGTLYIVDSISEQLPGRALMDLNMMVLTGGKMRTITPFVALAEASGLKLCNVLPVGPSLSVMSFRHGG